MKRGSTLGVEERNNTSSKIRGNITKEIKLKYTFPCRSMRRREDLY